MNLGTGKLQCRRLELDSNFPWRNTDNLAVLDNHDVIAGPLVRQKGGMHALAGRSDYPRMLGSVRWPPGSGPGLNLRQRCLFHIAA